MSDFKVGDAVVRVGGCTSLPMGTVCVIEELDSDGFVKVKGHGGSYAAANFEKPPYPNPPHKHAEIIKAWADGATIQFLSSTHRKWVDCEGNCPCWNRFAKYRIKPTDPNADKISST